MVNHFAAVVVEPLNSVFINHRNLFKEIGSPLSDLFMLILRRRKKNYVQRWKCSYLCGQISLDIDFKDEVKDEDVVS